ncbi:MAG: hypothetical protein U0835_10400 [Isosphaeraceae bacterium]
MSNQFTELDHPPGEKLGNDFWGFLMLADVGRRQAFFVAPSRHAGFRDDQRDRGSRSRRLPTTACSSRWSAIVYDFRINPLGSSAELQTEAGDDAVEY